MATTVDQFGKALAGSGLLTADELKAIWTALPAAERPKDGEAFAKLLIAREKLNPFQAEELLSGRPTPLVLGQYVLVDKIGAGGMGQVFKAQHRRMKRLVALKVLPAAMVKDEANVKRFQREVEAAAKLSHPNIVQAFDADEHRGTHYLVMEFVDGRDLSSVIKQQGPLPIELAVDYTLQAGRGLAFAHAEGVIHRDIKPANLLLDKKGVVKILDMGLARLEKGDDGLTGTEQVMGTVDYMSPEQASHTKSADARSDIYSLGCTLWYLLSAQRAYEGDTMIERLMAHREAPLPSLVKLRDDSSWALEQVLHKMLAKKPADRYQKMDDVVAALEPHGGGASALSGSTHRGGSAAGMGSAAKHDPELASFLKTVGPGPKTQTGKPGSEVPSKTAAGMEATEQFDKPELGTDPKSEIHLENVHQAAIAGRGPTPAAKTQATRGSGRKSKPPVKLMAAGVGGLAIASAFGIWLLTRSTGEPQLSVPGSVASATSSSTPPNAVASELPSVAQETEQQISVRHRAVAEWLAETMVNGSVVVEADGMRHVVGLGQKVPPATLTFRVTEINVPNHPGIPRDMFRQILRLEGLNSFGTYGVPFNDRDMQEFLHAPPSLTSVNVEKASFTDEGLAVFETMPQLQRLTIGQNPAFSDAGMRHLAGLTSLTWLSARQTSLGDLGLEQLAKLPLQTVQLNETQVTDKGLAHLHAVRTLTSLSIEKTQVTKAGVDALHAALPACRIQWDGGVVGPGATMPPPPSTTADYALQFSAAGNHVVIEEKQATDMQALTVEAFVTPAEVPANGLRIVQWTNGAIGIDRGGQWSAHLYSPMPKVDVAGGQVTPGRRTHVAAVLHQGKLKLYADGMCVVEADAPDAFVLLKHITIGGSDRFPVFFPGAIDEVRISTTARYVADFDPPTRTTADADTFALYHCDEGTGEVLADSSANKRDGKIVGAKWVRADGGSIADTPPADFAIDPAANPNGAEPASIELPRFLKPNEPMTIEMTVTPRSLTPTTISRSLWSLSGVLELKQYQDHWVWARNNRQADPRIEQVTVAGVVPGRRTQLAAVSDGKQLRLFIDGELAGTHDLVNPPAAASLGISLAGSESATGGYQPFDGLIDEIRISNSERYGAGYTPIAKLTTDTKTLALYHCDEGTGTVLGDSSGKNNHGTISGPQWARAASVPVANFALDVSAHLNPGRAHVELPKGLRASEDLTVEMFVTPRSIGDGPPINRGLFSIGGIVAVKQYQDRLLFNVMRDGTTEYNQVKALGVMQAGKRLHVAAVMSGDEMRLFIDGRLVGKQTMTGARATGLPPVFLGSGGLSDATWEPFDGTIDEIRISTRARYENDFTPADRLTSDAGTWGLYHCDEGSGDSLVDASGNNRHGVLVGAKWVAAGDAKAAPPPVDFALDISAVKDGSYAIVRMPLITATTPGVMTIEALLTPADAGAPRENRSLINVGGSALVLKQFGSRWAANVKRGTSGTATQFDDTISTEDLVVGKRVHLAAVTDGREARLYVDGKVVHRVPQTVPFPLQPMLPYIGGGKADVVGWGAFRGTIDEIRISSIARYTDEFTPAVRHEPDADTLALYHCDEGSGDKLVDASGHGFDGTVIGANWVRAADAPATTATDLLATFDPKRSLAVGGGADDWQLTADGLKFTAHRKPGLVRFPVTMVDRNFRMELEFTRTSGNNGGLNIDLPMTAGDLTVNLDDQGRSGLGKTDRVTRDFQIETGKRHRVVVTITGSGGNDHMTVEIDGLPTFDWRGDRQTAIVAPWKNPAADDTKWSGLFVHSGATDYLFHRLTVEWLDAAAPQAVP